MTQREALVGLLMQGETEADKKGFYNPSMSRAKMEFIADYLLANCKVIPIAVIERKIRGIDAAEGCDQAGIWDYQMRNALKDVLDWYTTPNYKETVEHTWF